VKTFALALFVLALIGCGPSTTTKEIVERPSPSNPSVPVDPNTGGNTCDGGVSVGYVGAVKSLIDSKCASCHPGYSSFETVSNTSTATQIITRINLPTNDARRMPKFPAPELSFSEKTLLQSCKNDGLKQEGGCKVNGDGSAFLDLNSIGRFIKADLDRIDSDAGQANARYVLLSHKKDGGASAQAFEVFIKGVNKGLNTLSTNDNIIKATPVDPSESIYRIELSALGLTPADWNLILSKDPYKFQDNTRIGLQIQAQTKTKFPWLHADNMMFIALGDPAIYNALKKIPATLGELQAKFGINRQAEIDAFDARLLGFNGSPISENKNRLLLRLPINDGDFSYWQTFDPDSNFLAQKNLSDFHHRDIFLS